jgi:two-component system chemotaxis sensor kinase CheA
MSRDQRVLVLVHASGTGENRVERINETAVLRLRDRLLPLIDLRVLLRLDTAVTAKEQLVIVTQTGAWRCGIVVDCVYDTEEIVVKPVAPLLKGLGVYSGNTILGDGSVCMIIDPNGIVARLGRPDISSDADGSKDQAVADQRGETESRRLLLVRAGAGMRKAIPLDLIARLEEIDVANIRHPEGRMLVQYRDRLMPLVPVARDLRLRSAGRQPVLVFIEQAADTCDGSHLDRRSRQIRLVVEEIVDIVESAVTIEIDCGRPDVIGSAIIGGEATEVVNTAFHLQRAVGDRFATGSGTARSERSRELVAEGDQPRRIAAMPERMLTEEALL